MSCSIIIRVHDAKIPDKFPASAKRKIAEYRCLSVVKNAFEEQMTDSKSANDRDSLVSTKFR